MPADGPTDSGAEIGRPLPASRRRRRLTVIAFACLVVAAGWLAAWIAHPSLTQNARNQLLDTGPRAGRAPAFSLPDVNDPSHRITLAEFAGQPIVVNFWASWCVPCRQEMPRLAAAAHHLAGKVAFVGIDYEDQRGDAAQFLRQTGVTYPSGYDHDGSVGQRYGLMGVPTTVFLDRNGKIVGRYLGGMSEATLDGLLAHLTAPAA
jgi:cytochrome c biogenesis protein CcmG/thiol:disulfide interchange protein DsbE